MNPINEKEMEKLYIDLSRVPLICQAVVQIKDDIAKINDKLDDKYVTKELFSIVQKIVFGGAGFILVAVLSALVYQVVVR